jgi:predicted nucleic acid-binding protein
VTFVIDNSVTVSWYFEDEVSPYADRVLSALPMEEALVPPIWPMEFANSLLMGERRNRISQAQIAVAVENALSLPIHPTEVLPAIVLTTVMSLARRYELTVYDATYLELAMREGLPLATQDTDLRKAAVETGVPIFDLT